MQYISNVIINCKWDNIIDNIPDCFRDENGNFFVAAKTIKDDSQYEIYHLSEINVKYTWENCSESGIIVHDSTRFNNTHLRVCNVFGAHIIIGKSNKIVNTRVCRH